ncbi:class I SAM-dependent methyltransferase [Ruminiclostridium herbifermentans]|uniref:Class I SAM-dependent methyltransferase n=1 Tax=Ruminiclostridium herbifermentans TaxID=2488810 RepID=A0A4U7JBS4_9FIRM|nr:class I SAM-dependent methyltransferase [Ruminiclostridium herbifermentans]QNU67957.1 class I SAM-dependent methyltransferase [Ruminiclostridium herbifermentans]
MPKLDYNKLSKNFVDKLFNNILDKCIIAIISALGFVVTTIISNSIYKVIGSVAIVIIIIALLIVRLLNKDKRSDSLEKPEFLLKCLEENVQNRNVKNAIKDFCRAIDWIFRERPADTYLYELCIKWLHYKENRIQLSAFVNELYQLLKNRDTTNNESLSSLKKIYNELVENIVNIKLEIDAKNRSYADTNDSKLKRDIINYEPDLGYWEKSDYWINEKMKKHVDKMRKIRGNQNYNSLNILDIGTGTGRVASALCKEGDFVCIIDSDKKRLSEAEDNIKKAVPGCNIKSIENSFEKFKDLDECVRCGLEIYFDVIICSHVIQHISTDVANCFYRIILNMLISDGVLFLLFPISKSNKEEFVVEGLEFDIVKLKKGDFLKSKKVGNVEKLDLYFRNAPNFDTFQTVLSRYNDNSGYWKVTKKASDDILFEIYEGQNNIRAYKRVFDRGLVCSIDIKYAQDFFDKNSKRIFKVINECLKNYNPYSKQISEKSIISSNILSEYWLICDFKNHINVMVFYNNNHYNVKKVNKVIKAHGVHNDLLKENQIPIEFLEFIPKYNKNFRLKCEKDKFIWKIINDSDKSIASIYKTEAYYSLILNSEDTVEVEIENKEVLLMKQVPSSVRDTFFKDVEHNPDFVVDSEIIDGWFIEYNGEVCYFARYDSDWIRIFMTERNFSELPNKEKLSIVDHNKFPFKLWNEEDIVLKPLFRNKVWKIEMERKKEGKFAELPNYIIRTINDSGGKYCAYRDKKYNNISGLTFNNLCTNQVDGLQILPTHRFVISNLKKKLKKEGFWVKEDKVYHSFKPKHCLIDKLCLRDKYFNFFILKKLRMVHRKFDIQDCMFVVKKKI